MSVIKAKDAVPGQWYVDQSGVRLLCVFSDAQALRFAVYLGVCTERAPNHLLSHLPGCTGWDWVPVEEKPEVDPGEGYRLLEVGELIDAGDEIDRDPPNQKWKATCLIGDTVRDGTFRRRIKPTTPDPGEGYRRAEGEDWKDERCEIWANGIWCERDNPGDCFVKGCIYRIPIDPAPKHPPIPKGWRLIDPEKDFPKQPNDAVFHPSRHKDWVTISDSDDFEPNEATYIRLIAPTHRHFASAAEFRPHRDRWWRFKKDPESMARPPELYRETGHFGTSWRESFADKVFEDGSPFGVEVLS